MSADVRGARKYKRPLIGTQLQQSFIRSLRIEHAEHIVDLALGCLTSRLSRFLDAIDCIHRHRLARHVEDGGLIHVVPEAGYTIVHKLFVEPSPPVAYGLAREVWEDADTR